MSKQSISHPAMRLTVRAADHPAPADIYIHKGAPIMIIWYAGQWRCDDKPGLYGATGRDDVSHPAPRLLRDVAHGALIGRIGDNPWFYIGHAWTSAASPREGPLTLACNDTNPEGNEGELVVRVDISN